MPGKLAIRAGAVAALTTAITTFLLWLLPRLVDVGADPLTLRLEPAYMGRLWVNLIHVFIALFGYGIAAALLARRSVTLAVTGFVAFAFWAFAEALGVAVNIFAVNGAWRAALASGAPENAEVTQAALGWFPAWWDAVFFVLLLAFLVGTTCFGAAAVAGRGLERIVGWLFLAATPLTLLIIASGYFGFAAGDPLVTWIYPALQPVSRALLGVWLWRAASSRS